MAREQEDLMAWEKQQVPTTNQEAEVYQSKVSRRPPADQKSDSRFTATTGRRGADESGAREYVDGRRAITSDRGMPPLHLRAQI
jgi:hypothetical protein